MEVIKQFIELDMIDLPYEYHISLPPIMSLSPPEEDLQPTNICIAVYKIHKPLTKTRAIYILQGVHPQR